MLLLLVLGGAREAASQPVPRQAEWGPELRVLAGNAALGGVTTGLIAVIRGDPVMPAVAVGSGGGALVYLGKRVSVQSRFGAGLIGRQVASVGSSLVGNEVAGLSSLDRLALSAGPLRFYFGRSVEGIDTRVDVPAMLAVTLGVVTGGAINVRQTVSSGAVVIRHPSNIGAFALPGTILHGQFVDLARLEYMYSHEQVHVLQYDQSSLFWGRPLEDWLSGRSRFMQVVLRHAEFNLPVLATALITTYYIWPEHERRPWEWEAVYLAETRRHSR